MHAQEDLSKSITMETLRRGRCEKNRIRLAIFILNDQGKGGVHTRSSALARNLKEHYETTIIKLSIQDILTAKSIFSSMRAVLNLIQSLRQADIVISFSSIPNLLNSLISKRSIISLSGSTFFRCDTSLFSRLYWTFLFEPLSVTLSDAVVPASPAALEPFLSRVSLFRTKIHRIHGFLDCRYIDHSLSGCSTDFNWVEKGYFLFIGELIEQKGILELIDIYASLPHDISAVQVPLVVCGKGRLLPEIAKRCEHFSISLITAQSQMHQIQDKKCIIWLGMIPEPYKIIERSAVVLAPFYWEGLSNVMLESLYLNTPVIASRNPSTIYIKQSLEESESEHPNICEVLHLVDHPRSGPEKAKWREIIIRTMTSPSKKGRSSKAIYQNFSAERKTEEWLTLVEKCTN